MQLEVIKVSNLLTFPYVSDLHSISGIHFRGGKKADVNVLIGPNGSGKSSFLEIVNQIFKVGLMKDYVYNKHLLFDEGRQNEVITEHKMRVKHLSKHFGGENKDSRVHMKLVLTENDYDNLGFICKYYKQINSIIEKYSDFDIRFEQMDFEVLRKYNRVNIHALVDLKSHSVTIEENILSIYEKFILKYLSNHELIQICMNIYNDIERKEGNRHWYALKNTFAIMGSYRDFGDIIRTDGKISHISPKKRSTYISGQNTKTYYAISVGYYLCMMKLYHIVHKIQKKYNDIDIVSKINESSFYVELNNLIKKYLGQSLIVERLDNGEFIFLLQGEHGYKYHFYELSSGIQSFLMIIMTIYGYDLEGGLLIIDEPEMHLHPQLQKKFIEFIDFMSDSLNLQVIFATHSPIMVNEKNIRSVYRFSKQGIDTKIKHPSFNLSPDEGDLIHMLKFENISKVFFVDKIILVEGETDSYFFDYYIQYLKKTNKEFADIIVDYEILNIHGKGGYKRWRKFLSKFGIDVYFIGDWDNVVDYNIISDKDLQYYNSKTRKYRKYLKSKGYFNYMPRRHYGILVSMIHRFYTKEFNYISGQIDNLYKKGIFLLKDGDLETYIDIPSKGLDKTISFCNYKFDEWIKKQKYAKHISELNNIIKHIFSS